MITIYKTATCPRCQFLMAWLEFHKIAFEAKLIDPDDADQMTEFRLNGIFLPVAPIMQVGGAYWYMSDELFPDGENLDTAKLRKIFQVGDI